MKELLWKSNFSSMDTVKKDFNIETRPSHYVNDELQRYAPESVTVENNELCISTTKHGGDIVSGRLNTKGKLSVCFGYVEASIRFDNLPKGAWPAFWMLGTNQDHVHWPNCGEIDCMEIVGWKPTCVYGTLHGPGYCAGNCLGSGPKECGHNLGDNQYHKYAVEWEPNKISWYIDDTLYYSVNPELLKTKKGADKHWVYNQPFYIIVNNAVGGGFGGAYPNSTKDIYDNYPTRTNMYIKYINIYRTENNQGSAYKA
jgi:beta-glucanase (GH16 family)